MLCYIVIDIILFSNQIMLTLDKITVQVGTKLFSSKNRKHIRIQTQNSLIKTTTFAKIINESSLQWDQSIQIPLIYDQEMDFQIYQKHQFGYNPQEIDKILYGKMSFTKGNDKYNNWQIYEKNGRKVGFLSVNIKSKPPGISVSNNVSEKAQGIIMSRAIVEQPYLIIISSIVVSIPTIKAKRGYVLITIGDQKKKTSGLMSRIGELVFVEKYQIQKKEQVMEGTIEVFVTTVDGQDEKVGKAVIKFNENKIDRRLVFEDKQNNQIGQGFIDAKIHKKSEIQTEKMIISMLKKSFNQKQLFQHEQSTKDLSKSILSNQTFNNKRQNQMSLDFSRFLTNVSIVNTNKNIKIPKQQRFFTSRDPANNKCSYLPEQSFEFKEKRVDKYYRGASIGYGKKADFADAKKALPGVGKYKLPSIWDRY